MLGELLLQRDCVRVLLHGELDIATVDELRVLLSVASEAGTPRVVVDVADVPFMDVLSLSTILAAADSMAEQGGTLTVAGARIAVRRVCALLNADDLLEAPPVTHREVC